MTPHRIVLVPLALALLPDLALAGAGGAEFNSAWVTLQSWLTGDLGRVIAAGLLLVGLSIGIVRQSVMAAVPAIASGLALNLAPTIISAIVTAVI
jgi:conjugal transfer pilus assembly protein TraA